MAPSYAAAARAAEREHARGADRRASSPVYRAAVHARSLAFVRLCGGCWHAAAEQAEEHARCVPSPLNLDTARLARRRSDTILDGGRCA